MSRLAGTACAVLVLLALSGCGDATAIPQAGTATPFAVGSVSITQQGNAPVTVDTTSVHFSLDDTRSLVVHLMLTSHATGPVTVSVRASLYGPSHNLVGDAVGGQINVQAGQPTAVQLSGPTPLGTIASAVVEASVQPSA